MCAPDPNAGIRQQAKIEHQKKQAQYHSESLKYWNREVDFERGRQKIAAGRAGAQSDVYQNALYTLGQARVKQAQAHKEAAKIYRTEGVDTKSGESRSRSYNKAAYMKILDAQSAIESSLDSTFGTNMALKYQKIRRHNMNAHAKNREALGVRPEYGVPVHMPPKDRRGQFFNSLSMGMSLAGSAMSFAALLPSDIKLKENIEKDGKSPKGYTIYTCNYKKDKHTRYRGVIAQDVLKINPMAVDVMSNGYLGVHYDKVDVPMEVIS